MRAPVVSSTVLMLSVHIDSASASDRNYIDYGIVIVHENRIQAMRFLSPLVSGALGKILVFSSIFILFIAIVLKVTAYFHQKQMNEALLRAGGVKSILQLLRAGADVNAQWGRGETALHIAAQIGRSDVVRVLIWQGSRVDPIDRYECTPLSRAVFAGNLGVVEILLHYGANVNHRDNGFWTPLYIASNHGDISMVEVLLEHGADPTIEDPDGDSPLRVAQKKGHTEIIELLQKALQQPGLH